MEPIEGNLTSLAVAADAFSSLTRWCPRCPTSRTVQAAVFGDGFAGDLALLLLPLLAIACIARQLHRVGLGHHTDSSETPEKQP